MFTPFGQVRYYTLLLWPSKQLVVYLYVFGRYSPQFIVPGLYIQLFTLYLQSFSTIFPGT